VSLTVVHALSGHALQRALALEQLGDAGNFDVAGSGWRSRILTELLEDNYDANRLLAFQALRKLNGFEFFDFDYIGTRDERQASVREARQIWHQVATQTDHSRLRHILNVTTDSEMEDLIQQLIRERNKVTIDIQE